MFTKLWLKAEVIIFLLAALPSHLYSHHVLHGPENLAVMCIPHTLPKLRKRQSFSFFGHKVPSNSPIQSMCNNTQSATRCPGGQNTPVRCRHWHPQYVFVRKVLSSYFKLKFSWYFLLKLFHFVLARMSYSYPEKVKDSCWSLQWEKGIQLLVAVLI